MCDVVRLLSFDLTRSVTLMPTDAPAGVRRRGRVITDGARRYRHAVSMISPVRSPHRQTASSFDGTLSSFIVVQTFIVPVVILTATTRTGLTTPGNPTLLDKYHYQRIKIHLDASHVLFYLSRTICHIFTGGSEFRMYTRHNFKNCSATNGVLVTRKAPTLCSAGV